MRLTIIDPKLLVNGQFVTKLFSLMIIPLETFNLTKFTTFRFPFSLEEPIWCQRVDINKLYMGLEKESVEALWFYVKQPSFMKHLCKELRAMLNSRRLHLITRPHPIHHIIKSYGSIFLFIEHFNRWKDNCSIFRRIWLW